MERLGEVFFLLALLGTLLSTLAVEEEGEEVEGLARREVLVDDDWTEGWSAISFTFLVVVSGYIVGNLYKVSPKFLYMNTLFPTYPALWVLGRSVNTLEKYKHRAIQTPVT